MSGVRVGTRLEQLEQLQARVGQEIALERRRLALEGPERPGKAPRVRRVDAVGYRLTQLGVTARQVKEWALAEGLIDEIRRGRVSGELIEAYATRERS